MRLEGKRVAILAENMYREMEPWVPYYRITSRRPDELPVFCRAIVQSLAKA